MTYVNTWSVVKFTETMLGRFLQGIDFYILVLSSLLMVFGPLTRPRSARLPAFHPLSPKQPASSFNVPPPDVSTPNLSAVGALPDLLMTQRPRVERSSSAAKLSEWLVSQRKRLSSLSYRGGGQDEMNVQLWNQNRAERVQSFQDDSPTKDSDVFEKIYGIYPDTSLGAEPFQLQPPPIGKPKLEAPRLGRGLIQSMTSRYSDLDLSPPELVDRKLLQADSPVFGLSGIVRPSTGQSKMDSPQDSVTVADQDRSSDLSDLFRKQEELDSTIAALKLLGDSTDPPSTPSSKESREPSTARSDFTLSNFPRPPWVDGSDSEDIGEPPLSPSSARTVRQPRLRYNPPSISVDNVPFDLIPPRIPAAIMEHNRTLSVPISESAESDLLMSARTPRFDSQGTQYDVTSFIGSKFLGLNGFPPFSRFHRSDE